MVAWGVAPHATALHEHVAVQAVERLDDLRMRYRNRNTHAARAIKESAVMPRDAYIPTATYKIFWCDAVLCTPVAAVCQ